LSDTIESLVNYAVLVAIAAVLVWFDLRFFALYSFMVIVGLNIHLLGRFWKFMNVLHASNAVKLLVIAKKLGISDDEFDRVGAELRAKDPRGAAILDRYSRDL
jgi:hypothetical protein